ncbi:MAG: hypothetical protein NUV57_00255 [archaeon]|nr:hypothetical protein [archaeon]
MQKNIVFGSLVFLIIFSSGCFDFDVPNGQTTQEKAVAAGDPAICMKASFPDVCLLAVAKSTGNQRTCALIDNVSTRTQCEIETGDGEKENCAVYTVTKVRDDCYAENAVKEQKATFCNEVTDKEKQTNCYIKVASAKSEWEVCERIENESKMNECVSGVAVKKKDAAICEHATIYNAYTYTINDCIQAATREKCDNSTCENMADGAYKDFCLNNVRAQCPGS